MAKTILEVLKTLEIPIEQTGKTLLPSGDVRYWVRTPDDVQIKKADGIANKSCHNSKGVCFQMLVSHIGDEYRDRSGFRVKRESNGISFMPTPILTAEDF